MPSSLERTFLYWWNVLAADFPEPVTEYRIIPDRRFRWDFAWPPHKLAIELHGGLWAAGAHSRPAGVQRDMTKANLATLAGWDVLYFSTDMLSADPERCIEQVKTLLEAA